MEYIVTNGFISLFFHRIDSLDELARSLRIIAPGATPEQSTNLMMSGQAFCQSFADLLSASDPAGRVEGSAESRQGILRAVSKVSETGRHLSYSVSLLRPQSPQSSNAQRVENNSFLIHIKNIGSGTYCTCFSLLMEKTKKTLICN